MSRVAVVRQSDNVCVNIIIAEASSPPPEGCFLIDVDHTPCDIGWIYDAVVNDFVNPNPPEPEPEPPVLPEEGEG